MTVFILMAESWKSNADVLMVATSLETIYNAIPAIAKETEVFAVEETPKIIAALKEGVYQSFELELTLSLIEKELIV